MDRTDGDNELRILILTPQGRDAALAERTLSRSGLAVHVCMDLDQLRAERSKGAGVLLVAEEGLPSGASGTVSVLVDLEPPWSSVPIVILLGGRSTSRCVPMLRALEQRPNVTFLERPVPKRNLVSALRAAVEARRLQYRVRDALDELETANRKKDEFLATLSHELRNPLAPIRNAVHVLKNLELDAASLGKASAMLAIVERQTNHLVQLVDDLLELSRITTGKIELKKRSVRLKDAIDQAIEMNESLIRDARHTLKVTSAGAPLSVVGDPVRLTQVVANLVNNAAKYTPSGGRIDVALKREGDQAVISVADNGIGISEEMRPRLFELFSRSPRVAGHSDGGLGIGLALVRSLVEMHGGKVVAQSDGVGRGSTFLVNLPLAAPQLAAPQLEARAAPTETPASPPDRRKILVVDDNQDVADSLALLLQSLGCEVQVAYSGHDAVAGIGTFGPQLVFLDIGMPGMDGYQTARAIRSRQESLGVVLIALSGWGRAEDRRRALEAGFDLHLTKPVSFDGIQSVLASSRGSSAGKVTLRD